MILVIYAGKYGTTKRYADWIAEAVGADLCPLQKATPAMLKNYDTVVYGAAVYNGTITGVEFVKKNLEELKKHNFILFTVGLTLPGDDASFHVMLDQNLDAAQQEGISTYYFLGAIRYKNLRRNEKMKMWLLKTAIKKKTARSPVEADILEYYNGVLDYSNEQYVQPLVEELRRREKTAALPGEDTGA